MSASSPEAGKEVRRFACTSCGHCCNRGPEMELSEATALGDRFITSVVFKAHSLPINERSEWAAGWWKSHESRIPIRPALEEQRRYLSHFASRRQVERRRDRQVFLTISAIVNDDGRGRCPALAGNLCSIYDARPLTCRTVPMHYSRPPSALRAYLDRFTATPDYRCDTSATAPIILDGNRIVDAAVERHREEAISLARKERAWKDQLILLMDDDRKAEAAGLPTYDAVLANTDQGYATLLPMIVVWRVAKDRGLLSLEAFHNLCRKQMALIQAEMGREPGESLRKELAHLLSIYEAELASAQRAGSNIAFLAKPTQS